MIVEPAHIGSGWHQHDTSAFGDTFGYPLVKASAIGWIAPPPAGLAMPWPGERLGGVVAWALGVGLGGTHIQCKGELFVELVEERLGCFPVLALCWWYVSLA